jgi:uncharacterized membrane protein
VVRLDAGEGQRRHHRRHRQTKRSSHVRADRNWLSGRDNRRGGGPRGRTTGADLIIEPAQVAVIKRDSKGRFHVTTTQHEVATGTMFGMFWGLLFGVLFFVPVLGLALGAGLGALIGLITKLGISDDFSRQVRDMLQPGTSALFLVVDKMTADKTTEALAKHGGTVLKTSLSKEAEEQLREALHGNVPVGS